jgi:hypothetical protein
MKKTTLTLAAVALLSACGGGSSPEPVSDLNPAMSGTWNGTYTVTATGQALQTAPGTLEVAVAGRTATITKVCPDGSGTLVATGSGNNAAWAGTLACPPVAVSLCPTVVVTLTSANGSLSADGQTMTVVAHGRASACGLNPDVTLGFMGGK